MTNNSVYFTTYTRRTDNRDSQSIIYDSSQMNSLPEQMKSAHSRYTVYDTFVSFKEENQYSSANVGPMPIKPEQKKLSKIFQIPDNIDSGLLVPGLISFSKNVVIFELPPAFKLVSHVPFNKDVINDEILSRNIVDSYIPVPWQVYVAIFDNEHRLIDTYMFYARNSIITHGIEEYLYTPALPNFYSNGLLCRPFYASSEDVNKYDKNISGVIAAAYDSVWNSGWNTDLIDALVDTGYSASQNAPSGKHSKEYFSKQDLNYKFDQIISSLTKISYYEKHKAFPCYIRGISDFSLEQIIHSIFAIPSFNKMWDQDYEVQKDDLANEFWNNNDSDEVSDEDLDNFISENLVNQKFILKSFETIIQGILTISSYSNLQTLSPTNRRRHYEAFSTNLRSLAEL
jgi:hypothetical protein